MYQLIIKSHFDAAHWLRNYQGKCNCLHGHTWQIEVMITGRQLNDQGMLIDFSHLKEILKDTVSYFDHRCINELPPFLGEEGLNPTAENLAYFMFQEIQDKLKSIEPDIKVKKVKVWESPETCAIYRED